jgi:hypothetical protein
VRSNILWTSFLVASALNTCFAGDTAQDLNQALPLKPTRTVKFTAREGSPLTYNLAIDSLINWPLKSLTDPILDFQQDENRLSLGAKHKDVSLARL